MERFTSLIKKPSAWVPIALSLLVLTAMLTYIVLFGPPAREADEGTGAHLFQLWLALEAVLVVFFAARWLPRTPRQALQVVALQACAALAAVAPVYWLGL